MLRNLTYKDSCLRWSKDSVAKAFFEAMVMRWGRNIYVPAVFHMYQTFIWPQSCSHCTSTFKFDVVQQKCMWNTSGIAYAHRPQGIAPQGIDPHVFLSGSRLRAEHIKARHERTRNIYYLGYETKNGADDPRARVTWAVDVSFRILPIF
jgi:hypothetical protein